MISRLRAEPIENYHKMASTSRQTLTSQNTLMALLKDIRSNILCYTGLLYEYSSIAGSSPRLSHKRYYRTYNCDDDERKPPFESVPVSIFSRCRSLFDETMALFYSSNTFRLFADATTIAWLDELPLIAWKHLK